MAMQPASDEWIADIDLRVGFMNVQIEAGEDKVLAMEGQVRSLLASFATTGSIDMKVATDVGRHVLGGPCTPAQKSELSRALADAASRKVRNVKKGS